MKHEKININDFVFQFDDSKTGFGKLISELNIAKKYSEKHKKKSLIISEKSIHSTIKKEAQRLNISEDVFEIITPMDFDKKNMKDYSCIILSSISSQSKEKQIIKQIILYQKNKNVE